MTSTSPRRFGGGQDNLRRRRVPAARETTKAVIGHAVPVGYIRPATQALWRDHVRRTLGMAGVRADRRATLTAVAFALMYWADWETLTTRPTWAAVIAHCKRSLGRGSRATVARGIAQLIEMRLIARVAHGRQGRYAGGADPNSNPNDAALYVLIVPGTPSPPEKSDPIPSVPGTPESETPPNLELSEAHPVRAREKNTTSSEPPFGANTLGTEPAPPAQLSGVHRNVPISPAGSMTSSRGGRLKASAELQRRLPVLRQISTCDLRHCLKVFLLAGWTVNDINHAFDWRPDGSRWPHDGATGVGPYMVRGWIRRRLAPWILGGTLHQSFSQRAESERARQRALARIERERAIAHKATVVAEPPLEYRQVRAHMPHVRLAWTDPACPLCIEASDERPGMDHEPERVVPKLERERLGDQPLGGSTVLSVRQTSRSAALSLYYDS